MSTLGTRTWSHTHTLNSMPVPDTLHLCGSYLIIPWGTIWVRDNLSKRRGEGVGKKWDEFEFDSEQKMERLGVGGGRAEIKNSSDSAWINTVLRYSFGLCWGSQSKHTLCSSLSVFLSCSLYISILSSPFLSVFHLDSSPLGVTEGTKEATSTSVCYWEHLDGKSELLTDQSWDSFTF